MIVIKQIFVTLNPIAWIISPFFVYVGNHTPLVLCAQLCHYIRFNCIIQWLALHFPQLMNSVLRLSVICINHSRNLPFTFVSL